MLVVDPASVGRVDIGMSEKCNSRLGVGNDHSFISTNASAAVPAAICIQRNWP